GAPRPPRQPGAVLRRADRALRGCFPALARARAGRPHPRGRAPPGLRPGGRGRAPDEGAARAGGRPQREDELQDPRGAGPEGAVHARGGGQGSRGEERLRAAPARGRPGADGCRTAGGQDGEACAGARPRRGVAAGNRRRCPIDSKTVRINDRIRAKEVRVIDEDGGQLGIMPPAQALMLAEEKGLDLVEIAATANPPVCRIMNSGKFFYQQAKRESEARKHQRHIQVKEVKFRPKIDEHDFQFKRRNTERFLQDGNKVKSTVIFRGREMVHNEIGRRILIRLAEELTEVALIEVSPRQEGMTMVQILSPRKEAPAKATKPKKGAEAGERAERTEKADKAEKASKAEKPARARKAPVAVAADKAKSGE